MSSFSRVVLLAVWVCLCMCVNIAGLDRVVIIQKLYENAKVQGIGFLPYRPGQMTDEEAEILVGKRIDYYSGRVMKIMVPAEGDNDEMDTRLYNRDNGEGAAERVVQEMRRRAAAC